MVRSKALTRVEGITPVILVFRGQRVILDRELAVIYGVTTKRLNEQVKRNSSAFPRISCSNSRPRRLNFQGPNLRP